MDPYDSDDEPIDFSKCRKKCRKTGLRGLYTEEEVEYLFEEEKPKPLPILPLEIMNKILYEFGGLEHPLTKFYKEVKSSLPAVSKIRTRRNDEEHIWFKKHFNLKNNMYCFNDGDFIEYTKSNLIRVFRGGLVFGFQITPIEQTGIIIKPFKLVRDYDIFYYVGRKEQEYKKKDLQDYLEVNKIKWYKSWTKQRLMKAIMSF